MRRIGGQLPGEVTWNEQSGQGRLEQALLAGYVVIAVIALITAATATMGPGLSTAAKETAQASLPHELGSTVIELLSASTDFIAAAGLLAIAGLILYRRRRGKTKAAAAPETLSRLGPPFLF
jgi:MYXO-CTERM domain-containing protein